MTVPSVRLPSWILSTVMALAVCLMPAAAASAQMPPVTELNTRLDPETAAAVEQLIESAASQDIPSEPLVSKALEGQSKGAPRERILLAVRTLATDLGSARHALGPATATSEIVAAAVALRAGVSPEVLSRLKRARGNRSLLLPLATLTDLVARGVPIDAAVGTVLDLAERGANDADYRAEAGLSTDPGSRAGGRAYGRATAPANSRPPGGGPGPATPSPRERPNNPRR